MTQFAFIETVPAKISATFDRLFADLEESETIRRAANTNVIILPGRNSQAAPDIVDALGKLRPSRFFWLEGVGEKLSCSVSAICQRLSKTEQVCSELIKLSAGPQSLAALTSVLKANLISGGTTELFIVGNDAPLTAVPGLAALADSIIFDSREFGDKFFAPNGAASVLLGAKSQLVDLAWIALSPFREQLKASLDDHGLLDQLLPSSKLEVYASELTSGWLYVGWVIDRLGFNIPVKIEPQSGSLALNRIDLGLNEITSLSIKAIESGSHYELDSVVYPSNRLKSSVAVEKEARDMLLRRHFLIGESITNYRGALAKALELQTKKERIVVEHGQAAKN